MSLRTGWEAILDLALAEDIGTGDVTTLATVPAGTRAHGTLVAKAAGVISGVEVAGAAFRRVDPAAVYRSRLGDGSHVEPGRAIAEVEGPAHSLLTAERVALNLLQRLSGVATMTARFVAAVAGT